jgi:hypothetical protein
VKLPNLTNNVFIVPRKISVTPINPTATEHSSIILSCDCSCSIQPNWFKNNRSIQYFAPGSPFTLLANGSLLINVTRHTAGNYSCEVRTSSWTESRRSREVTLEVWCKCKMKSSLFISSTVYVHIKLFVILIFNPIIIQLSDISLNFSRSCLSFSHFFAVSLVIYHFD